MIGIGLHIGNRVMGGGVDAQAQAHYNRVIADGGVVPAGLSGVNAFFTAVKTIYGTSDITTAVSVGLDAQYLGYKLGAGAGATSGQAAQKLYSCAGSSGDVVQTTAASQPLLLAFDGVNKYYQGVFFTDGNSCSCPITLTQTDTLEFITKIDLTNNLGYAIGTVDNAAASRAFYTIYDGSLFSLFYGSGLSQAATASVTTDRYNGWFRVTLEKSGSNSLIKFYKSDEFNITDKNLVTWVQIGSTVTGTYAAMPTTITNFNILSGGQGSNTSFAKVYYAQISETIGGSPLSVFNPNQYNASTSQTQWTSTTGEVWTINTGTATTGYKGVLVDRTIVMGDGIDDTILSGTLANNQYFSQHVALNPFDIAFSPGQYYLDGGGAKGLIYAGNNNIRAYNGSADLTFTGFSDFRLQYLQADFNNPTSNVYLNNANNVSGATGTAISTKSVLFSNNGSGQFGCAMITTVLSTNNFIDTPTQRTETYNLIRSLNNNAF